MDVSEIQKAEGAVTCCSLIFEERRWSGRTAAGGLHRSAQSGPDCCAGGFALRTNHRRRDPAQHAEVSRVHKSLAGRFARYAWGVLIWNVLTILWGAYVRATGAGAGCGSHWPLCNGVVVPRAPEIETLVEFTHRLTSGLALLLVIGLVWWSRRAFTPGSMPRRAAWDVAEPGDRGGADRRRAGAVRLGGDRTPRRPGRLPWRSTWSTRSCCWRRWR